MGSVRRWVKYTYANWPREYMTDWMVRRLEVWALLFVVWRFIVWQLPFVPYGDLLTSVIISLAVVAYILTRTVSLRNTWIVETEVKGPTLEFEDWVYGLPILVFLLECIVVHITLLLMWMKSPLLWIAWPICMASMAILGGCIVGAVSATRCLRVVEKQGIVQVLEVL